jgi:hypothetical protein
LGEISELICAVWGCVLFESEVEIVNSLFYGY